MPTGGRGISIQGTVLQSGTGASLRTIESKLREVVSVKDFGAVGDGSTDDTAAINTAITSVPSGTKLFFPAGTYHITGAVNASGATSNLTIEGMGLASNLAMDTATAYLRLGAQWTMRNFKVSSSQTTAAPQAEIYAQSMNDIAIDDVEFVGGGPHILIDTVSRFRVRNTRHQSLTAPAQVLFIYASDHGEILGARIDSFVYPASASAFRGISIKNSSYIQVTDPIVTGVDATTIAGFAGVGFAGSSNCSLTGGVINGLKNGDGVLTEDLSSDIAISGTTSTGNGPGAGAGANGGVGDGFDIYNSARIYLSGCNASNNGLWTANRHPGIEIFTSQDVTVSACDTSDNGLHGVALVGSLRTKLLGVTSERNAYTGLSSIAATSTVNTSGTAVTWTAGQIFGLYAANSTILINSVAYLVSSVTDTTHLVLTTSAGTQTGVAMQVDPVGTQIVGGSYSENNVANSGVTGQVEGMYFANGSKAQVSSARATDTRSPKLQTYGARLENTARGVFVLNDFVGNLTARIQDSVGTSVILEDDGSSAVTYGYNINLEGGAPVLDSAGANPLYLGYNNSTELVTSKSITVPRVVTNWAATVNIDSNAGSLFEVPASTAIAHAIGAPSNARTGKRITVRIKNTSGGALAAAGWNAVFKMAAWAQPANAFSRSIDFQYDGTNWVEISRTLADVPN